METPRLAKDERRIRRGREQFSESFGSFWTRLRHFLLASRKKPSWGTLGKSPIAERVEEEEAEGASLKTANKTSEHSGDWRETRAAVWIRENGFMCLTVFGGPRTGQASSICDSYRNTGASIELTYYLFPFVFYLIEKHKNYRYIRL